MKPFDLKSCRSKLEEHYQKTATVPTSVWCKKSVVDIRQIYTRLSWVKEEQTPAGTTQSELKHYSDLFTANKDGVIPKRILVQGQTGIGKSTFVKKLLVDWVEVSKETGDEQAAVLKNFELVVAVNLKEVSKCQSLKDVIRLSNVFAKEDKYMTEGLVDYITNNQEKVLLIFDGYDEYHSGLDSEIYEIFRGNSLRRCCVLITTRISKADELRGGEDLHAEITGFSEVDRESFMCRFLNSKEVLKLQNYLKKRELMDLAKVPLLLLFFCILWKRGQSADFPGNKTKLYTNIIQFILNHSQSKKSPPQYLEVISFKEVLSGIGKIALLALLKNDHLFEYSQLSDSVRCDESVFIGLLQITEYSETLQPVGMVSFIHKSIQEFLAAWYITHTCIPEGRNLSEIGVNLEVCLALENVFQFTCGLSEEGAFAAFRHLKSVRISDPSLDFSQTIPDVENETYVPLSDVTDHQWKFTGLITKLFANTESRAEEEQELFSSCMDCLGGVLCESRGGSLDFDLVLLAANHTKSWYLVHVPRTSLLRSTESLVRGLLFSEWYTRLQILAFGNPYFLKVKEFCKNFCINRGNCSCGFYSILCFRNGQVYLYITHLALECDSHARLFTETVVPPHPAHSGSGESCLKFLKTLYCRDIDSLCDLLQQVPNPCTCSLSINLCTLTSKGALELATLLPRYENVIVLDLHLAECSEETVTKLVAAVKHKTLEKLELSEMNLTSAGAEVLGQSLSELSALQTLKLSGSAECSDEALRSLITAIKHKTLQRLELSITPLTSAAVQALDQSLPGLSALKSLKISGLVECSNEALTSLITTTKHKTLEDLEMNEIILTLEVAEALAQALPKLSALRTLKVSSADGCSLRSVCAGCSPMEFPSLTISGLSECYAGVASRLIDALKYKTVCYLVLWRIHLTSSLAKWFGQWLPELSALQFLFISSLAECSDEAVTKLVAAIKHKTLERLELSEISLTSSVADALGQSLPELSALQTLKISGWDGCSSEAVTSLISAIKHKSLEKLELSGIHLTSATAEALSQSLPELSALQILELRRSDGCSLLWLSLGLRTLEVRGWIECSPEAARSLFAAIKQKTPGKLELRDIYLTSAAAEALRYSLPELSVLQTLEIIDLTEYSAGAVTKLFAAIKHQTLTELKLSKITLTSAVTEALGQSLSELSALQTLKISGSDGCSLQRKEMEALFNRFNRPSSLTVLWITDFTARGCLAPLAKNLVLFPCLEQLLLKDCDMSEDDFCGFLEISKFTSDLRVLNLEGSSLGHAVRLMVPHLLDQRSLEFVFFRQGDYSEEDLDYVRKAVKERRPQVMIFSSPPMPVLP